MDKLTILLNNLRSFDADAIIRSSVQANEKPLIEANQTQLTDGKKTDGSEIMPPYSSRYATQRRAKGLQIGHVDLKVTGALYRGINLEFRKAEIEFSSRVDYSKYLVNRYVSTSKAHIYGVTDDNLKKVVDAYYKDDIITRTKKHIYNGL